MIFVRPGTWCRAQDNCPRKRCCYSYQQLPVWSFPSPVTFSFQSLFCPIDLLRWCAGGLFPPQSHQWLPVTFKTKAIPVLAYSNLKALLPKGWLSPSQAPPPSVPWIFPPNYLCIVFSAWGQRFGHAFPSIHTCLHLPFKLKARQAMEICEAGQV